MLVGGQYNWQTLWLHAENRVYTSHATVYAELVWPFTYFFTFHLGCNYLQCHLRSTSACRIYEWAVLVAFSKDFLIAVFYCMDGSEKCVSLSS